MQIADGFESWKKSKSKIWWQSHFKDTKNWVFYIKNSNLYLLSPKIVIVVCGFNPISLLLILKKPLIHKAQFDEQP